MVSRRRGGSAEIGICDNSPYFRLHLACRMCLLLTHQASVRKSCASQEHSGNACIYKLSARRCRLGYLHIRQRTAMTGRGYTPRTDYHVFDPKTTEQGMRPQVPGIRSWRRCSLRWSPRRPAHSKVLEKPGGWVGWAKKWSPGGGGGHPP